MALNKQCLRFDWSRAVLALMITDLVLALFQLDNVQRMGNPALQQNIFLVLVARLLINLTVCGIAVTALNNRKGCA